jgi:D-glycero-beta-D-manno-heptose-7-phosphate kinase
MFGPMATKHTLLQERLMAIIRRFSNRRVLVVGDALADQFVYGVISRVSREAPVFILRHEQTETIPGGAANCAVNLASLGASVSLVSAVGTDEAGQALLKNLKATGVNCAAIVSSERVRTTTKVRVLAGQQHSTRQQVIRIDYESEPLADAEVRASILAHIREHATDSDAIIISDYNYGVATEEVVAALREATQKKSVPVFVDSRFRLSQFSEFTSATPNEDEVEHLLGYVPANSGQLVDAADQLRERLGYRALLVTRGSHGMMLLEEGVAVLNLSAVSSNEAVDVTGAGDTVIATYSLALASDASFPDAARLANHAGGLVVMKRGTASITAQELEDSVLHSPGV